MNLIRFDGKIRVYIVPALFLIFYEIGTPQHDTKRPADRHRRERADESDGMGCRVRAAASLFFFLQHGLGIYHSQGLLGGRREP